MRGARDLLLLGLVAALPIGAWPRPLPVVGLPGPLGICPVRVEAAGAGVGCLTVEEAARAGLHPGDRLVGGSRERMAPARLAAWQLPVDLNRASLDELASLDGVGAKLAARIAAARPFASVDELARVRGLGAGARARLGERVTVILDE